MMPVRDVGPARFVMLGRDITERLHAREQQAAIQGLLAKVFQCVKAPVGIVSSDSGTLMMSNSALDDYLGYAAGALVGKLTLDLVAPDGRAGVTAAQEIHVKDGRDYTLATRLLRVDGTEVAAEITSTTVQRADLRRFRIVTVLRAGTMATAGAIPLKLHIAGKMARGSETISRRPLGGQGRARDGQRRTRDPPALWHARHVLAHVGLRLSNLLLRCH
jgi:PAS domain S-box-containing protein